jgi:DUF1680 family protein
MSFDIDGEKIQLEQRSNWPWDGNIHFELKTALRNVRMKLRIPGWASSFEVGVYVGDSLHSLIMHRYRMGLRLTQSKTATLSWRASGCHQIRPLICQYRWNRD